MEWLIWFLVLAYIGYHLGLWLALWLDTRAIESEIRASQERMGFGRPRPPSR